MSGVQFRSRISTAVLLLAAAGCSQRVEVTPVRLVAPAMVVEQFLGAVNAKDYMRMGSLFGTKDGPVTERDDQDNVEKRMFALASVLRHEDYKVEGEQPVPGRPDEAVQLTVIMTIGEKKFTVPFTVVRSKGESWLVEDIGITNITFPKQN